MYSSRLEYDFYQTACKNDIENACDVLSNVAGLIDITGEDNLQGEIDVLKALMQRKLRLAIRHANKERGNVT
jgi:hypothetical protein